MQSENIQNLEILSSVPDWLLTSQCISSPSIFSLHHRGLKPKTTSPWLPGSFPWLSGLGSACKALMWDLEHGGGEAIAILLHQKLVEMWTEGSGKVFNRFWVNFFKSPAYWDLWQCLQSISAPPHFLEVSRLSLTFLNDYPYFKFLPVKNTYNLL